MNMKKILVLIFIVAHGTCYAGDFDALLNRRISFFKKGEVESVIAELEKSAQAIIDAPAKNNDRKEIQAKKYEKVSFERAILKSIKTYFDKGSFGGKYEFSGLVVAEVTDDDEEVLGNARAQKLVVAMNNALEKVPDYLRGAQFGRYNKLLGLDGFINEYLNCLVVFLYIQSPLNFISDKAAAYKKLYGKMDKLFISFFAESPLLINMQEIDINKALKTLQGDLMALVNVLA